MFFVDIWVWGNVGHHGERWDSIKGDLGHHGVRWDNFNTCYIHILYHHRVTENTETMIKKQKLLFVIKL